MVYRSGTLSRLSSSGVASFRDLGIRTVIDLRNRLSPLPFFNGDVFGVYFASTVHGCPVRFEHTERASDFYLHALRPIVNLSVKPFSDSLMARPIGALPLRCWNRPNGRHFCAAPLSARCRSSGNPRGFSAIREGERTGQP